MSFLEFEIPTRTWSADQRELLIAKLSFIGFESFVEEAHYIKAYITRNNYSNRKLDRVIDDFSGLGLRIQFHFHELENQSWNDEWEKNFDPVIIDDQVLIRAPFHDLTVSLPYVIEIEPKMSFGTGHHQTTRLMIREMLALDLKRKDVLDMGCGTGVLGIFASMRGASSVTAIDIDQWAYNNTLENIERNQVEGIRVLLGDAGLLRGYTFHVILANITRNILIRDIPAYTEHLQPDGTLVLSGILSEDVQYILDVAFEARLNHMTTQEDANWLSLSFIKSG